MIKPLKPLKKYSDISKAYMIITLSLFILLLIWIVVFKANIDNIDKKIAAIKAKTIAERFRGGLIPFSNLMNRKTSVFLRKLREHVLNVFVFVPFGVLLPFFIKKRKSLITAIIFTITTFAFEIQQLLTGLGGFDVTDLMTNILGGFIGLWLYKVAFSKIPDHVINRISFVVNIIFAPVLVFAILNTIKHFDYYI